MRRRKIIVILCFLLVSLSVAGVSAGNLDDATIQTSDGTIDELIASDDSGGVALEDASSHDLGVASDEIISPDDANIQNIGAGTNEDDILGASFSDLQSLIDNAPEDSEIDLDNDYSISNSRNSIRISKSIRINGNNHSLDGRNLDTILKIGADGKTITLSNIVFKNGGGGNVDQGGAIFNPHHSTINLYNCVFEHNKVDDEGGAIYTQGDLNIYDAKFDSNIVKAGNGGAIYCNGSIYLSNATFTKNEVQKKDDLWEIIIRDNAWHLLSYEYFNGGYATYGAYSLPMTGGAIFCVKNCTVYDSKFDSNVVGTDYDQVATSGGAIHCIGNIFVSNTTFSDNSVNDWGGGAIFCEGNTTIYDSKFNENTANRGCAIYSWGETQVFRTEFSYNTHIDGTTWMENRYLILSALDEIDILHIIDKIKEWIGIESLLYLPSYGGAVWAGGTCLVDSCRFNDNLACEHGGAIYCEGDLTVTGKNNTFKNNRAYRAYGESFLAEIAKWGMIDKDGGAIYACGNAVICNASFSYNEAIIDGGAIYCEKEISLYNSSFEHNSIIGMMIGSSFDGGAIHTDKLGAVDNCIFIDNNATPEGVKLGSTNGGAIFIASECHSTVSNSTFNSNNAGVDAGAIYCPGTITISDSKFNYNNALGTYFFERSFGGAVHSKGLITVENSEFGNNYALNRGGAIYADGEIRVSGSSFYYNSVANAHGGAIFASIINSTVSNSAFSQNTAGDGSGGGIYINNKCDPTFVSCQFTGNRADDGSGGGIYMDANLESLLTLSNCTFADNEATGSGGAVFLKDMTLVDNYHTLIMDNCNFTNNKAGKHGGAVYTSVINSTVSNSVFRFNTASSGKGGALYINNKCDPKFSSCSFEHNSAGGGSGGAIYMDANEKSSLKLSYCNFTNNNASDRGGAVFLIHEIMIDNCNFTSNHAGSHGGAVYASTINSQVPNSIFHRNTASSGKGGALYINNQCDPKFLSCSFCDNSAGGGSGGAIYMDADKKSSLKLSYCNFTNNNASDRGGAVFLVHEIMIDNCNFTSNHAGSHGGAVYASTINSQVPNSVFNKNTASTGKGGAIYLHNKCDPKFLSCSFQENNCKESGGAIYMDAVESSLLKLSYCNFTSNKAGDAGGAVYLDKELAMDNCNFISNSAKRAGAVYAGAINQEVPKCLFKNNHATSGDGGAIIIWKDSKPKFRNCVFDANTCTGRGGSIYSDSVYTYLDIGDCDFSNCSASEGGAVYTHQLVEYIFYSTFLNNTATSGDGGALYVKNNDPENYSINCEFRSCRFEGNTAKNRGGAVFFGSIYSHLKVDYCTFVDNHADKKNYQGKKCHAGHSIFNEGYYKTIDMCWFGKNDPSFKEELVEYHKGGTDEDHVPDNYLRIYIKINDTEPYVGNPYNLTVYFNSTKGYGLSKDLMHSTGRFFGDGDFSNLNVDLNDMTSNVVLTKENPTISAQLDHQVVTLKLDAKTKNQTEIHIISCEDVTYPDELKVTYEIINGSGNEYFKVQDSDGNVVAEGKITDPSTLYVSKLSPGDYTLTMYALETLATLPCNVTKDFKVLKRPVSANVTVENVSYGTPSVIRIKADFDATYKVDVNGTLYEVIVKDGVGSKSISGLNAGDYHANVALEDENYILTPQNALFTVNKADIDLVIVVFDELYGQDVEGIVYSSLNGDYDLVVAGQSSVITVVNNLAYFNIGSGLEVGTYEANVSFAGNENYNPAFNKTSFQVHQDMPLFEIEATPDYFPYGQTAIVSHKLPDDASGTIKYFLHDGTFLGELVVSENLTLPILDMGFYGIIANYSGDHNYAPAMDAVLILVDLAPNNAMVTVDNVTYGDESLIVVSADVDGIYQVDINGTQYNITVNNGVGSKSIALDAGVYYANVTFDSWNYDTSSINAVFEVYKANTNMHVLAYDIIYSQDLEGIIHSDVDGEYNLSIGDFSISVTVKDGHGEFNAGIFNAGYYTVIANYSGDANHKFNSSSIDIHIAKYIPTISLDIQEIDYGDVGVVNITCDVYGSVNVTVNGITETLDLHGQRMKILFASLLNALSSKYDAGLDLYNLNAGTYPVTVTYNGGDNYESPSVSGELKVNSVNATMDIDSNDISVGEDEKITITLPSDATGNVTVTVDGKEYSAEVKDGKAVISIPNLSSGNKEAKISYSGDKNYNPAEDTVSFSVNKLKPKMSAESNDPIKSGEKLHMVVKLPKDATGTVTVTVDGKEYSAEVKDGKAIFDIPGLSVGKYDLKAYYSGDDKYCDGQIDLTVTVKDKDRKDDNNTDPDRKHDNNTDHGKDKKHNSHSKVSRSADISIKSGNPILALVFALMTVGIVTVRRFEK